MTDNGEARLEAKVDQLLVLTATIGTDLKNVILRVDKQERMYEKRFLALEARLNVVEDRGQFSWADVLKFATAVSAVVGTAVAVFGQVF